MSKKYENGYQGKIQYWTGQLNAEVMNTKTPDIQVIRKCVYKLEYFVGRQESLGLSTTNVIGGVDFGETLEMLNNLKIS
jgi:hypothetical protein